MDSIGQGEGNVKPLADDAILFEEYRGAGTNTWTAISSTSRTKEQTMLVLKSSSLIWEY